MKILDTADVQAYITQFDLPENYRETLAAIIGQADERASTDAELIGEPSVFLKSAAHCAVLSVLCRGDKTMQKQAANSYWSLIRMHRQLVEGESCSVH